ncbi:hypothetical protein EJ05DRAFT_490812 [Pseudovirgaria hyperparasitica]|uniref:SET domain-containing protein n=1 Tax=Pseudovirgaria hyperparasitica TaxID=470096 RepID=A0A6A6VSH8_9PEZI|nr:uncharacterized protein EJ05DRAFT_490812 [Pseudovirgaria hyperparasitica]KAF2752550.1 hypothetical protein EJ05DRAFT_490812 [Pseudovirgaria hyperparasitica]
MPYILFVGLSKHGFGCFALQPVPAGTILAEYEGYLRPISDEPGTVTLLEMSTSHCIQGVSGTPAFHMNHSTKPNASFLQCRANSRQWIPVIQTKKRMSLGDEVRLTYSCGNLVFEPQPEFATRPPTGVYCQRNQTELRGGDIIPVKLPALGGLWYGQVSGFSVLSTSERTASASDFVEVRWLYAKDDLPETLIGRPATTCGTIFGQPTAKRARQASTKKSVSEPLETSEAAYACADSDTVAVARLKRSRPDADSLEKELTAKRARRTPRPRD